MSAEERRRLPIEGIGSLLFGLWLIIMPGFFADLLTFVLGFILVLGGVQQIASLSAARRWMPVRVGFYIIPVLILIAGLVALFNPTGVRSTAFIIIGISSIVYAVSGIDKLVHIHSQTAEGIGYAGSFFKGCRQY